jgi:GNAT superfamily N-acetyltransferase
VNSGAQQRAPEQASVLMVHGGSDAISSCSLPRATLGRTSSGRPASFTPWTAKTFLARSMPTYKMAMDFPFRTVDESSHFPSWHFVADHRFTAVGSGRGSPFHSLGVMQPTIERLLEKYPEPEFANLQRAVFAGIERESAALSEVLSLEQQAQVAAEAVTHFPMVRFGAYINGQLIGWSCGWLERGNCFYMANSGVSPEHQGNGVYSALLQAVLAHARELGAQLVRSQHSVLNNRVIVCKLRRGFHIAGISASAQMGSLVELVHHMSEPRLELFRSRVVPFVAQRNDA